MVRVELVAPGQMPRHLVAYAICEPGCVVFIVRSDVTPARMAAAISWLGEQLGP